MPCAAGAGGLTAGRDVGEIVPRVVEVGGGPPSEPCVWLLRVSEKDPKLCTDIQRPCERSQAQHSSPTATLIATTTIEGVNGQCEVPVGGHLGWLWHDLDDGGDDASLDAPVGPPRNSPFGPARSTLKTIPPGRCGAGSLSRPDPPAYPGPAG